MFPNVLPKKVPQTLVYGVRQVLIQPQTEDVLSISRKSQFNTALPSLRDFVDEITGDSNVPHLTSAIHNVAQGIVQVVGVERLKDIAAASLPDTRPLSLDEEPPAYYGYMNPEELLLFFPNAFCFLFLEEIGIIKEWSVFVVSLRSFFFQVAISQITLSKFSSQQCLVQKHTT
jgi:hypothetical protein